MNISEISILPFFLYLLLFLFLYFILRIILVINFRHSYIIVHPYLFLIRLY